MKKINALVALYSGLAIAMTFLFLTQLILTNGKNSAGSKDHLIDIWCATHFLWGAVLAGFWHGVTGETFKRRWKTSRWLAMTVTCICAWEMVEFPMEIGVFGPAIKQWMDGVEPLPNRFLVDPVFTFLGAMACRQDRRIYKPALVLTATWATFNLLAPTAMSVQGQILTFVSSVF